MKWRNGLYAGGILLCVGALALALAGPTFTWDGSGSDDDWDTCDNWTATGGQAAACYPSTGSDDVIVPTNGSTWFIDLITVTIDDLTIDDDVTFGAVSGSPTLTVDTISITGPADVVIDGATISTS